MTEEAVLGLGRRRCRVRGQIWWALSSCATSIGLQATSESSPCGSAMLPVPRLASSRSAMPACRIHASRRNIRLSLATGAVLRQAMEDGWTTPSVVPGFSRASAYARSHSAPGCTRAISVSEPCIASPSTWNSIASRESNRHLADAMGIDTALPIDATREERRDAQHVAKKSARLDHDEIQQPVREIGAGGDLRAESPLFRVREARARAPASASFGRRCRSCNRPAGIEGDRRRWPSDTATARGGARVSRRGRRHGRRARCRRH